MLIQVLGNTDIRLNELQYLTTHSLEMGKLLLCVTERNITSEFQMIY